MTLKSIKISAENYDWLVRLSGDMQKKLGKPVSIDYTINSLRKKRKISEYAGAWDMNDKEWEEINNSLSEKWKKWKSSA